MWSSVTGLNRTDTDIHSTYCGWGLPDETAIVKSRWRASLRLDRFPLGWLSSFSVDVSITIWQLASQPSVSVLSVKVLATIHLWSSNKCDVSSSDVLWLSFWALGCPCNNHKPSECQWVKDVRRFCCISSTRIKLINFLTEIDSTAKRK